VQSYERAAFDRANGAKTHQLTYVSGPLDPTTARLAEGHPAVIPSLSDVVDAPILETLAKRDPAHGQRRHAPDGLVTAAGHGVARPKMRTNAREARKASGH
jgi:hypothetical protein